MTLVLTPKEAAEYYGVSATTLRKWSDNGKVKTFKTEGGHRRYVVKEIEETKILKDINITDLSEKLKEDLLEESTNQYWNDSSEKLSKELPYQHLLSYQNLNKVSTSDKDLLFCQNQIKVLKGNQTCLNLSSFPDLSEAPEQITRKIRFYPNHHQKKLFNKCFGAHNYFYNKAVEMLKENNKASLKDFREAFIPREEQMTKEQLWMKEIPIDTREAGALKALDALTTCFALKKKGIIKQFNLSFRSKKRNTPIFYVAKSALKKDGKLFPNKLKRKEKVISKVFKNGNTQTKQITVDYSKLKVKKKNQKFLDKSDGIFSISKQNGRYYINVVIVSKKEKVETDNICALDPGIRTFQTLYSENSVGEFGADFSKKLYRILKRQDRYISILTKENKSKKKCKLRRLLNKLRTKAKNIVSDLHWKTCDFLTKNFKVILLPVFNTKNMANRMKRKIGKVTTRLMLGLSHYSFQQKLLYKAKMRDNHVILCKEHYTSQCCGICGKLNKVGSSKIYQCDSCNLVLDRDLHAARNILIRGLSLVFGN